VRWQAQLHSKQRAARATAWRIAVLMILASMFISGKRVARQNLARRAKLFSRNGQTAGPAA